MTASNLSRRMNTASVLVVSITSCAISHKAAIAAGAWRCRPDCPSVPMPNACVRIACRQPSTRRQRLRTMFRHPVEPVCFCPSSITKPIQLFAPSQAAARLPGRSEAVVGTDRSRHARSRSLYLPDVAEFSHTVLHGRVTRVSFLRLPYHSLQSHLP